MESTQTHSSHQGQTPTTTGSGGHDPGVPKKDSRNAPAATLSYTEQQPAKSTAPNIPMVQTVPGQYALPAAMLVGQTFGTQLIRDPHYGGVINKGVKQPMQRVINRTNSIEQVESILPEIMDEIDSSARQVVTKKGSGMGLTTSHLNSGVMTQLGSSYGLARQNLIQNKRSTLRSNPTGPIAKQGGTPLRGVVKTQNSIQANSQRQNVGGGNHGGTNLEAQEDSVTRTQGGGGGGIRFSNLPTMPDSNPQLWTGGANSNLQTPLLNSHQVGNIRQLSTGAQQSRKYSNAIHHQQNLGMGRQQQNGSQLNSKKTNNPLLTTMTTLPDETSEGMETIEDQGEANHRRESHGVEITPGRLRDTSTNKQYSQQQGPQPLVPSKQLDLANINGSTSELGFTKTANQSFFPGKRVKNRGHAVKKLLPTTMNPTGVTYTSGGGKVFEYEKNPTHFLSQPSKQPPNEQKPQFFLGDLGGNTVGVHQLEKLMMKNETKEPRNKNFFMLQSLDNPMTGTPKMMKQPPHASLQLPTTTTAGEAEPPRHFFLSTQYTTVMSPPLRPKMKPLKESSLNHEGKSSMKKNAHKSDLDGLLIDGTRPPGTEVGQLSPDQMNLEIFRGSTTLDHIAEEEQPSGIISSGARSSSLKKQKKRLLKNPDPLLTQQQNTIEMFTSGDMRKLNHTLFNKKPNKIDFDEQDCKLPTKSLLNEQFTQQVQKYNQQQSHTQNTGALKFPSYSNNLMVNGVVGVPQSIEDALFLLRQANVGGKMSFPLNQLLGNIGGGGGSNTNPNRQAKAFQGNVGAGGAGGSNFLIQTKKSYMQNQKKQQWIPLKQSLVDNKPISSGGKLPSSATGEHPLVYKSDDSSILNVPFDPTLYYKTQSVPGGPTTAIQGMVLATSAGSQFRASNPNNAALASMQQQQNISLNSNQPLTQAQKALQLAQQQQYLLTASNTMPMQQNSPPLIAGGKGGIVRDPQHLTQFLEIQRVTMAVPQNGVVQTCPKELQEHIKKPGCCQHHLSQQTGQIYQFLVSQPPIVPSVVAGNAYLLKKKQQQAAAAAQEEAIVQEVKQVNPGYLHFVCVPGNNSGLIRDAMLRRSGKWKEATSYSDHTCHFRWQPVSYGIKFDQLGNLINPNMHPYTKQLANHFENHMSLTEKSKLFKNLTDYALNRLRENVFNYIPLTFFVEVDISKTKHFAKAMLPFFNSFYALEDNKKKVVKYYEKLDEHNQGSLQNLGGSLGAKSAGILPQLFSSAGGTHDHTQSEQQLKALMGGNTQANNNQGEPTDPNEEAFIFKHFYNNRRGLIKQHIKEEKEALDKQQGALKKNFFRYSMPFCHFTGFNLWLLKPTKLNRGRGIHVINNLTQLKQLIQRYCDGWSKPPAPIAAPVCSKPGIGSPQKAKEINVEEQESPSPDQGATDEEANEEDPNECGDALKDTNATTGNNANGSSKLNQLAKPVPPQYRIKHNSFILQKYIEKPFLIYQRKFDIRVWVMLNYDTSLYFFPEGYLRTSSSEFSIDPNNPDDQYVHLTNNAIQKYSQNYGSFEDGNQMSFQMFQDYLESHGYSYSVKQNTVETMKSLIMRSMLATRKIIDPQKRKGCFELFGYDFIIDEDFNTWLIEVNTNPCIEESSRILKVLLPRMIDDMLKLSVDTYFSDFNPKRGNKVLETIPEAAAPTIFPVEGYNDEENMWEFMCKLSDQQSRRQAKIRYIYQSPHTLNSKFAFQVQERDFKIKKYHAPVAQIPPHLIEKPQGAPANGQIDQSPKNISSKAHLPELVIPNLLSPTLETGSADLVEESNQDDLPVGEAVLVQ